VRRYLLILAALFGVIAGVAVLSIFRSPTLGLDLQGGLEVVLEARPEAGQDLTEEDLDRSVEIIRNRVDKLGVPEIRKQGSDQIVIGLAGVFDQGRAADIIGQTAQLEFYDLQGDADPLSQNPADPTGMPQASPTLLPLLTAEDSLPEGTDAREWYLYSESKSRLAGPAPTKAALAQQVEGGEIPEGAEYYVVPEGKVVLTCGHTTNDEAAAARPCPGGVSAASPWYYLYRYEPNAEEDPSPALTGDDLNADGTRQDFGQDGQPNVLLDFTDDGGDRFQDITQRLAQRGQTLATTNGADGRDQERAFAQSFAIVLDNEIR
jgi:preprotein translocase subunit SecD